MAVIGLPVNLGAVADCADRKDAGGRFALKSVYVEVKPAVPAKLEYAADGHGPPVEVEAAKPAEYRVSATDTKQLIVVEGEAKDETLVPGLEAVRNAPNSGTKGLFPLATFKKVFADAAKATKYNPACRQVLMSMLPVDARFGYCDFETEQVQYTPLMQERFPPVESILKDTRKKAPKVTFAVDPKMLAGLLKTMASFCDAESMRVEIEVRDPERAILLTCSNPETGQKVTGLVMPLAG